MNNFNNDLQRGKYGERIVAAALTERGHKVIDVSQEVYYQYKDIDFLLTKNGKTTSLEVKNDIRSNETGNIFIEMFNQNNVSRNYRGWFLYCEATYFCFLQQEYGKGHIIHHDDLIALVESGKYRQVNSIDTRGIIIPIEDLKQCSSYYCLEVGGNDKIVF